MDIRFAETPEELQAVYRLRYELVVAGQGLFSDEADHRRRMLTDAYDPHARILIAVHEGEVIGTLRLIWGGDVAFTERTRAEHQIPLFDGLVDDAGILLVTRMCIRKAYRGQRLAVELIGHCMRFCAAHGISLVLGNCEPHMLPYYLPLGYRTYGRLFEHPVNGMRIGVAFVVADRDHLARVGSPLCDAVTGATAPTGTLPAIRARLTEQSAVISEAGEHADSFWAWVEAETAGVGEGPIREILAHPEHAGRFLEGAHALEIAPEQSLYRTGQTSRTIYILMAGTLACRNGSSFRRVTEPGTVVGEAAFFNGARRTEDLVAGPDGAQVIALSDRTMRRLKTEMCAVAARFFLALIQGAHRNHPPREAPQLEVVANGARRVA